MLQARGVTRLALESSDEIAVESEVGVEGLDHNLSAEGPLVGTIDRPHGPGADPLPELEPT